MHAFVQIGELYYDSSQPMGCKDMIEMEYFGQAGIERVAKRALYFQTTESFKVFWGAGSEFDDQDLPRWPTVLPTYRNVK